MRDQYAGDVSDAVKFGFLRALAAADRRLGIAWYYALGHDGRPDGRHTSWMAEAAWQVLDPEVHSGLSQLAVRSIDALETAPFWPPGTLFHRDPVPEQGRQAWAERMRAELSAGNLIFLDPDNGIGNDSDKHASMSEIEMLRERGRSVVLITFPERKKHPKQVQDLHTTLLDSTGALSAVTLRVCVSVALAPQSPYTVPTFRWLTVLDADGDLLDRMKTFSKALNRIPRVKAELNIAP